jgi:hypothetical protein
MTDLTIPEALAKLDALKALVTRKLSSSISLVGYSKKEVASFYERFASVQDGLKRRLPGIFGDMPACVFVHNADYVTWTELDELRAAMRYCIDILKTLPTEGTNAAKLRREGVFFAGQTFDAMVQALDLITTAHTRLLLVDGYVSAKLLNLLAANATAQLNILTNAKYLDAATQTAAEAFKAQYGRLEIRSSDEWHDRFLLIDDADLYHFGASLKDLGKRGFMFSRIEEPTVMSALTARFASDWQEAAVVV